MAINRSNQNWPEVLEVPETTAYFDATTQEYVITESESENERETR